MHISIPLPKTMIEKIGKFFRANSLLLLTLTLTIISILSFITYYRNGLGVAYNDARSHLDIGRRVVEGLKPGLAQLGSVWLPLTHLLMVPTVWNDFMWHSGLAGAIQSMVAFVCTGILIYKILERLKVGLFGRWIAVAIFTANVNILYLQSTAMTELLLLGTMTAGCFYLLRWYQQDQILDLIKTAFWIMLSTLIRYDGWFLLFYATALVIIRIWIKRGYKVAEGMVLMFVTLGGLGIALWLLWNQLIFKDPLYFAFGPFSAYSQQAQLESAGVLVTKHNLALSSKIYFFAMMYNSYTLPVILAFIGLGVLLAEKKQNWETKLAATSLMAPLIFNILALFLGHSVLFVQGLSGNSWFNVRYGIMLMPSIAVFAGFLIDRARELKWVLVGILSFVLFFAVANKDAVTIDDATIGSSQKNVTEVSGWLNQHAKDKPGFVLISVASHDAIIFSSGLPMKKFIHEGTGTYWESATIVPDRWARWIIMRTYDNNDLTWKAVSKAPGFSNYTLVGSYPFADIYEIKPEFIPLLNTTPILGKQK